MSPQQHVCNGLARPADESMLARTTGQTSGQTTGHVKHHASAAKRHKNCSLYTTTQVKGEWSNTANITKKPILPTITSPKFSSAADWYHLLAIFAVLDVSLTVNLCIILPFFYISICRFITVSANFFLWKV